MNYIVLSRVSWENYEYKRMLELLPDRGEVCFAGRMTPVQQRSSGIRSVTLAEIYSLNAGDYTLLVSSPYWLPDVLALQPAYTVALLELCPEGEDSVLWDKYSALLAAKADLAGTTSERIYLEQNLRRKGIVYLSGDQPLSYGLLRREEQLFFLSDYEAIWNRALTELWQPPVDPDGESGWLDIQRRHRTAFYISMCAKMPHQPSVHYLAASYLYLRGDEAASLYLAQSFELMLLHDYTDCLHSHYRFFSAIEAKKGNLELAVRQYEITAFTAEERAKAAQMKQWLSGGEVEHELLRAEILTVNEDGAAANEILSRLTGPEARQRLLLNYIGTFQWLKALQLYHEMEADGTVAAENTGLGGFAGIAGIAGAPEIPGLAGSISPAFEGAVQLPVIEGTLHLLYGRRHDAIRSFLRSAGADQGARQLFAEMADMEEAVQGLRGRAMDGEEHA